MDYHIAKPNRTRQSERKTHSIIVGAKPPTGVHSVSRKELERRRALALRKAVK